MALSVGQRNTTRDIKDITLLGAHKGQLAPELDGETLDGRKLSLADLRGKVVFIDFWATWCAPCVAEIPNVMKVYEEHGDDGLVVIGISFDRDAKTVQNFIKRKAMPWPQMLAKGELAKRYGLAGIPATFLVGPDGKVVAKDLRGEALIKRVAKEIRKLKAAGEKKMATKNE